MLFTWTEDGVFAPRPSFRKRCDETYAVGEIYRVDIREDRSPQSHGHYFASIRDAWLNLPEHLAERFPTQEHLRKWALIEEGYRDERVIAADSAEEAKRLVALVRSYDDFAIVTVEENIVTVHTAKSQSMRAMNKTVFQESKERVLGRVAGLIDVTPEDLQRNAGKAA